MKKTIFSTLLTVSILSLSGCDTNTVTNIISSDKVDTAENTAKTFTKNFSNGNYKKIYNLSDSYFKNDVGRLPLICGGKLYDDIYYYADKAIITLKDNPEIINKRKSLKKEIDIFKKEEINILIDDFNKKLKKDPREVVNELYLDYFSKNSSDFLSIVKRLNIESKKEIKADVEILVSKYISIYSKKDTQEKVNRFRFILNNMMIEKGIVNTDCIDKETIFGNIEKVETVSAKEEVYPDYRKKLPSGKVILKVSYKNGKTKDIDFRLVKKKNKWLIENTDYIYDISK